MHDTCKMTFEYVEFGKFLRRFDPEEMIHLVSDNFYVHAPVYVFRSELRSLLPLEICFNEQFPNTVYL